MKKNLENENVFKQIEKTGLNKEEIMFIFNLIAEDNKFLKEQLDKTSKIKSVISTMGSLMGNMDSSMLDKMKDALDKGDESIVKLEKEVMLTSSIINKLTPLKEIFE